MENNITPEPTPPENGDKIETGEQRPEQTGRRDGFRPRRRRPAAEGVARTPRLFATRARARGADDPGHLSFIESGRAAPSRHMILRLAATTDLPLRQQNALLLAAGYAPAWRERDLSAPALEVVKCTLDYMLEQHEPYPGFVVNRRWNLLRANRGALNLTEFLTGPVPWGSWPNPSTSRSHCCRGMGCGRSSPIGRTSRCISCAAFKPTPMPTGPRRRQRC